jgi:hypothetical protein
MGGGRELYSRTTMPKTGGKARRPLPRIDARAMTVALIFSHGPPVELMWRAPSLFFLASHYYHANSTEYCVEFSGRLFVARLA